MNCDCTITADTKMPGRICNLHFAHIVAAVAAEREACAKLAEDFEQVADMGGDIPPWDHIAAAIRARGDT